MSGITWDLAMIGSVRRLWVDLRVDTTAGVHREVMRLLVAERLRRGVESGLALRIHLGDVAFREIKGEQPFAEIIRAYWAPESRTVEIVGGHVDGELMQVQRVGDAIRLLRPPPAASWVRPSEDLTALELIDDTYELVGWREVERRWVYGKVGA